MIYHNYKKDNSIPYKTEKKQKFDNMIGILRPPFAVGALRTGKLEARSSQARAVALQCSHELEQTQATRKRILSVPCSERERRTGAVQSSENGGGGRSSGRWHSDNRGVECLKNEGEAAPAMAHGVGFRSSSRERRLRLTSKGQESPVKCDECWRFLGFFKRSNIPGNTKLIYYVKFCFYVKFLQFSQI